MWAQTYNHSTAQNAEQRRIEENVTFNVHSNENQLSSTSLDKNLTLCDKMAVVVEKIV